MSVSSLSQSQKDILGLIYRAQNGELTESEEKNLGRGLRRIDPLSHFLTQTQVANMRGRKIGAVGKDFQTLRRIDLVAPLFYGSGGEGKFVMKWWRKKFERGSDNPYCMTLKGHRYINVNLLTDELNKLISEELSMEDFSRRERTILGRRIRALERAEDASMFFEQNFKVDNDPGMSFIQGGLYVDANAGDVSALLLLSTPEWREFEALRRTHTSFLKSHDFRAAMRRKPVHDDTSFLAVEGKALYGHAMNCRGCAQSEDP